MHARPPPKDEPPLAGIGEVEEQVAILPPGLGFKVSGFRFRV